MLTSTFQKCPNPLRAAFEKRIVAIKDLMHATGFSRAKVSRHIHGVAIPDQTDRAAYAAALRIDPVEFDRLWFGNTATVISEAMGVPA